MTKWEKIKASAVKKVKIPEFPAEAMMDAFAERRGIWESIDELKLRITKRIMAWDVRAAPKLRGLFPRAFPTALRSGTLTAWIDENEDWVLERLNQ